MFRTAVRKSAAAAGLVVGLALVAPPPAAALPWVGAALSQAAKVAQAIGAWWGTYTDSARISDDTGAMDPDGLR